jgi:hypothetical protein
VDISQILTRKTRIKNKMHKALGYILDTEKNIK